MKPKRPVVIVVPAVLVLLLAWLAWSRWGRASDRLEAAGTVEATEAQLGFQVPGRLERVAVNEGDRVKTGDELARLDHAEARARREQAVAQADASRALLLELERGSRPEEVAQAQAAADAARQRRLDAERDLERTRQLRENGAVSQEKLDKALTALDMATSQDEQAREQLRLVQTGPRRERIAAQRASLAQAEAAVRVMDATLANMVVRAPFGGVVTVRHREPGEVVPAGSAVLTVMNRDDRWVRVFIPENRIGAVRIGQPAVITSDTFRKKRYRGEVVFIASEAEFTPKSVQTQEERVKLVYAVKVRITGDPDYDLKPGIPADVVLEGGKR
jgi:HlyD family secretion protein